MKDKLSVIIPVYNTKKYLRKCINSICNQSYKNLEIICIDDGSDDGSEKIIDEFARMDKRIIVIHKTNGGESSARNRGLQVATGDLITFVDCDDWVDINMYEDLINIMQEKNVQMVASNYYIETDQGQKVVKNNLPVNLGVINRDELLKYVYQRDDFRGFTGYLWCKIYKKEILCKENGAWHMFDEDLKIGGDILYFSKIALNTKMAAYTNKAYYHYYQRRTSTYHSKNEIMWVDILKTYQAVIESFNDVNIKNNILILLKRFLVYRAELIAIMAYENKNRNVLELTQGIMMKYHDEYFSTNQKYPERLMEYQEILKYEIK